MMERSTKFLSLAGWSGIVTGIFGLASASIAIWMIGSTGSPAIVGYEGLDPEALELLLLTVITLLVSIATVVLFSYRKSSQKGEPVWNAAARRLVLNMAIPLLAGAIMSVILWHNGVAGLIPAAMLVFYGMAMLNAGNFTYGEVRYLGMIELALGLLAAQFSGFSLIFWAMGFGVMHIAYGIYLHVRYEK